MTMTTTMITITRTTMITIIVIIIITLLLYRKCGSEAAQVFLLTLASIRTSRVLTGPAAAVTPDEFGSSGRLTCGKRDRNSGTSTAHSSGMASVTYERDSDGGGVGGGGASTFGLGAAGTVSSADATALLFLAADTGSPRFECLLPLPVA